MLRDLKVVSCYCADVLRTPVPLLTTVIVTCVHYLKVTQWPSIKKKLNYGSETTDLSVETKAQAQTKMMLLTFWQRSKD